MNKLFPFLVAFFSVVFLFSSCSKKNVKKDSSKGGEEETIILPTIEVDGSTETISMEAIIRDTEFHEEESLETIRFDFDRYNLSENTRNILASNAKTMKQRKGETFLVEGHCDNRGTIEYNLALGQKRANEVRDYYIRLGVPENRIGTISYGEENPACSDDTETCWAENRRAETKIKIQR